ncbi:MAG TPA: hypothetical protein VI409_02615 [Gaiellaceae bacterium]|nr:hypothetical protein [Gaiellaceae bacterium]
MKGSVLVIVREASKGEQGIVGGIPSNVVVSCLDEIDGGVGDSGEPSSLVALKSGGCLVDRELDEDLFFVWKWPSRTVTYELPRNMIERASVVVNGVSEPGGERKGKLRRRGVNDDTACDDGTDPLMGKALIAFWLDTEGWVGVTVEEPDRLSPGGCFVEVRPRKLDASALKGIAHEADND